MGNVKLNEGFSQVCVWQGTTLGNEGVEDFIEFMKDTFQTRVQFLEEIKTNPDLDRNGEAMMDSGGRSDLFFAVHKDDVSHFAIPRLKFGIRWIEDVYGNGNGYLYPDRVAEYRSWDY